jgi:hypothetical protein
MNRSLLISDIDGSNGKATRIVTKVAVADERPSDPNHGVHILFPPPRGLKRATYGLEREDPTRKSFAIASKNYKTV